MRKLLPYEHQLIEALGITEQEYWQFYLAQLNYRDEKVGTIFDVRNEVGTIALVLTIVGTLAQAGAALLAPKPELPEQQKVGKQSRNAIFGPRYGFNSFQEVARYGDPVNLVYTNKEDDNRSAGGLRVNTSLVWSAVQSFGNKQFIQMLGVVGAGDIEAYEYGFTAFGQAPLEDFPAQKYWLYGNNASGPLKFGDFQLPPGNAEQDPSKDGQGSQDYTYRANKGGAIIVDGYSQAFSPSSNNTLGLYDVVPINVLVLERDENGQLTKDNGDILGRSKDDLGTRISSEDRGIYWPQSWQGSDNRPMFPEGASFTLRFVETDDRIDDEVERAAQDYRIALISTMTASSVYKLGAAKFKLTNAIETRQGREGEFTFQCVESGILCEEDYGTTSYLENEVETEELLQQKREELQALDDERKGYGNIYIGEGADVFLALQAEFDQVEDEIEALTSIIKGTIDDDSLYDAAKNSGQFNDLIKQIDGIEDTIKAKRDLIEEKNDEIADLLDDKPQGYKGQISSKKQRKRALQNEVRNAKNALKDLYAKLSRRATLRGLYDGNPRSDAADERKRLKRRKNRLKTRLGELASTLILDTDAMAARDAAWQARYDEVQGVINECQFILRDPERFNDYFNVKCLAKIDELTYTTVTKCDIVDFALKARVYKRISGRQSKYGDNKEQKHRDADNGLRIRTAMFWMLYKKESDDIYQRVPTVFAIRRGVEVDNFVSMRFVSNEERTKWSFKMEPIIDLSAEIRTYFGEREVDVAYLDTRAYKNSEKNKNISIGNGRAGYVAIHGRVLKTERLLPPLNNNPGFVDEWGVFSMRSDTQIAFSFDGGPEIALAAVTEQQIETFPRDLYQGLSLIGFNAYSGKGIQDLRTLSAYVTKGKKVRRFAPNQDGDYVVDVNSVPVSSTSYAPEIFLDSVLDKENGIGAYADINGIDLESLGKAVKFCKANGYFMDGIIADPQSWREFWTTVAPFSLLEFTKIGGKESLAPAVPYDENGLVDSRINISALFNQGNILEGSYKEEFIDYGDNTEDLLATIVYRDSTDGDPFPGNTSFTIRLANADEASCIRQTFDLSAYVSSRNQAINYGMLLCSQRRWSKRAVEFKTFPTESPVAPGSYIYVQTDQNQWDNLTAGKIGAGGSLDIPLTEGIVNATYDALLYKGGQGVIKKPGITIVNNTAPELAAFEGWLVVFGNQITNKRVFRVTEITMEEEGEVTIRAIEHPCDESSGTTYSRIVQFDTTLYQIDD
jgi:hypothetical protein